MNSGSQKTEAQTEAQISAPSSAVQTQTSETAPMTAAQDLVSEPTHPAVSAAATHLENSNGRAGRSLLSASSRFANKGYRGDVEEENAPAADEDYGEDVGASFFQPLDADHPLDLRPAKYCDGASNKPGCPYEKAKSSFLSKGTHKDKVDANNGGVSRTRSLLSDAATRIAAKETSTTSEAKTTMAVGDHRKSYTVGGQQNLLQGGVSGTKVAAMPQDKLSGDEKVFLQSAAAAHPSSASATAPQPSIVSLSPHTLAEAIVGGGDSAAGTPTAAANMNVKVPSMENPNPNVVVKKMMNPFLEPNTRPGSELFVFYILPLFLFFMVGVAALHFFFGRQVTGKGKLHQGGRATTFGSIGSMGIDTYAAKKRNDEEGESGVPGCEHGAEGQLQV